MLPTLLTQSGNVTAYSSPKIVVADEVDEVAKIIDKRISGITFILRQ